MPFFDFRMPWSGRAPGFGFFVLTLMRRLGAGCGFLVLISVGFLPIAPTFRVLFANNYRYLGHDHGSAVGELIGRRFTIEEAHRPTAPDSPPRRSAAESSRRSSRY